MKKFNNFTVLIFAIFALLYGAFFAHPVNAKVRVKSYHRSSGTYVLPHYRTNPDSRKFNNWSTKGNTNPYTGKKGTKNSYNMFPLSNKKVRIKKYQYKPPASYGPYFKYQP